MTTPDPETPQNPVKPDGNNPQPGGESVEPLLDELKQRVQELSSKQGDEGNTPEDEASRKRAAAELLYQQASQTRAKALKEHERATELRARLGQIEADQRQSQLDLDLERERIAEDRAELEANRDQLSTELEQFEQEVAAHATHLHQAKQSNRLSGWQVLIRSALIALVAGLSAGGAWFGLNQDTTHLSSIAISVTDSTQSIATLAAQLSGLPPASFLSQDRATAWQTAVGEGRVQIEPQDDQNLQIVLQGPHPLDNTDLLNATFDAFSATITQTASDRSRDVAWRSWEAQRSLLATQLDAWQERLGNIQIQRSEIPGEDRWRQARQLLDAQRAEARALTDELDQARSALIGLQSLDLPRGNLTTEAFGAALRNDPVYQQDVAELDAQSKTYQAEVLLGKVLLVDALESLRESVRGLAVVIEQQVELKPSLGVQAILEDATVEIEDLNQLLNQFANTWNARKQELELIKPASETEKMLALQQASQEALVRVAKEVERVQGVLRENVQQLGQLPGGGTRENVVAAMLRGEISHLGEELRALREGGVRIDPTQNFKLDAADRQVRSLRGRIRDRQERVRGELQAAADEEARGAYEQTVRARQREISDLDERRDQAMDAVVAQLEVLRELEESSRALVGLDAEKAALQREVRELEARREELLASEPQPVLPTVAKGALNHVSRETDDLLQTTGTVAGGVFGISWLAGGLLLVGFTRKPKSTGPLG